MQPTSLQYGDSSSALAAAPLFYGAVVFAAGIGVAERMWMPPAVLLASLLLLALVTVAAALGAQRVVWLPVALLWFFAGSWSAEMEVHPGPEPALAALSNGLMRGLEGVVVDAGSSAEQAGPGAEATEDFASRPRIDLALEAIETVDDAHDALEPAHGTVRVLLPADAIPVECGDRLRLNARPVMPVSVHDPGVFSRLDYLNQQGVTSTAQARQVERIGHASGLYAACRLHRLQQGLTARVMRLPTAMQGLPHWMRLSNQDAAMLAAMVLGDRGYLTHSLRLGFERTGSFHMLVVSGFHLAIVAGFLFWLARRLRMGRLAATLLALTIATGYALLTGFATPVARSLWMVGLYLLARLLFRERNVLNTIGFAALCLLVASPRALFEASLQMTLLAVVAIGGIAAPLLAATVHPLVKATEGLRYGALDVKLVPAVAQFRVLLRMFAAPLSVIYGSRVGWLALPWLVRMSLRVVEAFVVSLVAELVLALPMAIYFHRITLAALPVNALILPMLLLLMPLALAMLAALAVLPWLAVVPAAAIAVLLHAATGMVGFFGSMAVSDLRLASPLLRVSLVSVLLVLLSVALARRGGRLRLRMVWVTVALAALLPMVPRGVEHPAGVLLVEAIDVGQGDSILLITPSGQTMLVDGGGIGGGPLQQSQEFDVGEEIVSQVLWSRGIRHLDVVALTHAHADHMGGLPSVLRNFHPNELWVGDNPPVEPYRALLDQARALGVRVRTLHTGDRPRLGEAEGYVLTPFANHQTGSEPVNDDSLVMRMSLGDSSVLLEGDAEASLEQAMLADPVLARQVLPSTLLKVGHHGSHTSTTRQFLAAVHPKMALISCGLRNRYGHPHAETLDTLAAAGVLTQRTDIGGAACVLLDGKSARPDLACGWRWDPN